MKIDENGVLYDIDENDIVDGKLIVPNGVKKIDLWKSVGANRQYVKTFSGEMEPLKCQIKRIELPNSLIEIADKCFCRIYNLESIVLPDSVSKLGTEAFRSCEEITEIRLSNKLEEIPQGCFFGCKNLDHIVIPDSVKK